MFKSAYKAVASAMNISTPIVDRSVDKPSDKMLRRKKKKLRKKKDDNVKIEIEVSGYDIDSEGGLVGLLEEIKRMGNAGNSRSIKIEDYGGRDRFDWDGDGSDKIDSLKVDGEDRPKKKGKKIKKYALEDSPQTVKVKRAMQAAIIKMNGLSRAILTVLLSSQKPTRATINKFATQMSFAHSLLKKYKKLKGTDEYSKLMSKLAVADTIYSRLIKRLGGPDEIQGVQKVFGSAALRAGMAVGRRAIKPLANIARRTSAKAGIKAGKKGLRTGLKAIDRAGRKATVVGRKLARKHVPKKARGAAKFVAPLAGEMAVANRINAVRRRASSAAGFDKAMSDIDGIKKMIVDETKRKKRRKRKSQTPYVHAWRFPGVG